MRAASLPPRRGGKASLRLEAEAVGGRGKMLGHPALLWLPEPGPMGLATVAVAEVGEGVEAAPGGCLRRRDKGCRSPLEMPARSWTVGPKLGSSVPISSSRVLEPSGAAAVGAVESKVAVVAASCSIPRDPPPGRSRGTVALLPTNRTGREM